MALRESVCYTAGAQNSSRCFLAISYIDGPMCLVTSALNMEAVFFSKTFPITHKSRLCHNVEDHFCPARSSYFYENKRVLLHLTVGS